MAALIAASAVRTCFGDGAATFAALLAGASGRRPLQHAASDRLNVAYGYQAPGTDDEPPFAATDLLTSCLQEALDQAGVDVARRCVVVVGSGLGELRSVERAACEGTDVDPRRLHFAAAVRRVCPTVAEVLTLSNACSAGGHALAVAQDLVESGEADVAVAAGTDTWTASMLAMIGRVAETPTREVQPFDADRTGVLLGDGAAAVVLVPDRSSIPALGRLLATGLSCDAFHDTAPDLAGIVRAMRDALARARCHPDHVDLVVAHGTGTALNDPVEAEALAEVFGARAAAGPLVTALKGAVGHTSGSSFLVSLDVALRSLAAGVVPPVVGLERPLPEAAGLQLVQGGPVDARVRLAQVEAFGFGGVNAVALVEGRAA